MQSHIPSDRRLVFSSEFLHSAAVSGRDILSDWSNAVGVVAQCSVVILADMLQDVKQVQLLSSWASERIIMPMHVNV